MRRTYIVIRETGTGRETRRVNITGCTQVAREQVKRALLRDMDTASFYIDYMIADDDDK